MSDAPCGELYVDVKRFVEKQRVTIKVPMRDGTSKTLHRDAAEPIEKSFQRLLKTLARGKTASGTTTVTLERDGAPVAGSATHAEAWSEGSVLTIDDCETRISYLVRLDAPEMAGCSSVDYAMVGYPLPATAHGLEFCQHDEVDWRWYADGEIVGQGRVYTPTKEDFGKRLAVEALDERFEFTNVVTRLGVDRSEALRRLEPSAETSADYRIMTYNVLADAYAHTWGTMFPYFDTALAKVERRLQLVLEDILRSKADVVALQEVDKRYHETLFVPVLTANGYIATDWVGKSGQTLEGCAMFFALSKFESIEREEAIKLTEIGDKALRRWIADDDNAELAMALKKITSIAQLARVKVRASGKSLCVGNTHLFFHPGAMHLRVLQAHEFTTRATAFAAGDPLVLCGDFNGEPEDGVIRYLTKGEISASDEDWVRGSLFRWGGTSSRDAARDLFYICDDGTGYETFNRNFDEVTNTFELRALAERGIFMSLCARTLDKEWGASCKCDEKSSDDANAIAAVKKHVKCGCTLKNCHAVAAFTLRRESGLAPGLTMDADDHVIARRAFSDIKRAQDDGFAAVSAKQAALASSVVPDASAVPIGCGAHLRTARPLFSAGGFLEWTNYVGGFVGALDYVWCSTSDFASRATSPLPDMSAVLAHTALPNAQFPSDHIPVIVDVDLVN
jgi:2',5'-phosphodiesterase